MAGIVLDEIERTSDLAGATLSVLVDLALDTTEPFLMTFRAGSSVWQRDDDDFGRYTASMLFPSKSTTAAL